MPPLLFTDQTGICVGHATDLWRIAISNVGSSEHFCFKSDNWCTHGVKPDVAWHAVSDAVFSVTFFPVIVVGQMVQAPPSTNGNCLQGSYGQESQGKSIKIWLDQGVRESLEIFENLKGRESQGKILNTSFNKFSGALSL